MGACTNGSKVKATQALGSCSPSSSPGTASGMKSGPAHRCLAAGQGLWSCLGCHKREKEGASKVLFLWWICWSLPVILSTWHTGAVTRSVPPCVLVSGVWVLEQCCSAVGITWQIGFTSVLSGAVSWDFTKAHFCSHLSFLSFCQSPEEKYPRAPQDRWGSILKVPQALHPLGLGNFQRGNRYPSPMGQSCKGTGVPTVAQGASEASGIISAETALPFWGTGGCWSQ